MYIDDQWMRINPETDSNGDRLRPLMARMVRTDSGMVIGRIVLDTKPLAEFVLQLYRHGEFVEVKRFDAATPVGTLFAAIEHEINAK